MALAAPTSSPAPAPAPANPAAEAEITAVLHQAEVEVRGLGQNSRVVGRQSLRQLYGPDLLRAKPPRMDLRDSQVRANGASARLEALVTAWVTPELPEGMEGLGQFTQEGQVPGRLSAILEKQERHWVFLKMLLVFPGGVH